MNVFMKIVHVENLSFQNFSEKHEKKFFRLELFSKYWKFLSKIISSVRVQVFRAKLREKDCKALDGVFSKKKA